MKYTIFSIVINKQEKIHRWIKRLKKSIFKKDALIFQVHFLNNAIYCCTKPGRLFRKKLLNGSITGRRNFFRNEQQTRSSSLSYRLLHLSYNKSVRKSGTKNRLGKRHRQFLASLRAVQWDSKKGKQSGILEKTETRNEMSEH